MSKVLIIGAGGVGRVVAHKCAALGDVFSDICLASRTKEKADQIASELARPIQTARLDADKVEDTVSLIRSFSPRMVIHVALPYQDLSIMEACLQTGVDYLDTANYEPPDQARFEYSWQWAYRERFLEAGKMALLGSGFDPGVTNVFCAYAQKHLFDEIHQVDILDCNAGDHGYPFATNFNPEINIREVTARGRYWEQGEWKETDPLSESRVFDFPDVGDRRAYLMYHEELESLCLHLKGLRRIRFWMTFGDAYLTHLRVLENIGMTGIEPVEYNGQSIVPLQFLKAVLPDPASLGPRTQGKTCIGCLMDGIKDGQPKRVFIYNVSDHQSCYREVNAQAVSYTTGVPAMIGAKQMLTGQWHKPGVFNMEELDPDPFMKDLNEFGLPWRVQELACDGPSPLRS
ncbi:MAG: saccharopine dehydrogenase family protein [Verrucomicrobia bacterium]|nr:saccharopine dehydrogenase family protein [Verrucomicrobiota bacterium]